jgi:hypothetical protein
VHVSDTRYAQRASKVAWLLTTSAYACSKVAYALFEQSRGRVVDKKLVDAWKKYNPNFDLSPFVGSSSNGYLPWADSAHVWSLGKV